jgi:hypothetical protein
MNMRTVRPFWGLSIFRRSLGFSPQWLHAGTGFGSKPEKTSFLNSLFIKSPAGGSRGLKLQTEHLFQKDYSAPHLGMERFVNQKSKLATAIFKLGHCGRKQATTAVPALSSTKAD